MKLAYSISLISFFFFFSFAAEYNEAATNAMHVWILTRSASEPMAIQGYLLDGADPNAPNPLDNNHVPLMTAACPVFYPELSVALLSNGAVLDNQVIEWVLMSAKVEILLYYLRNAPIDIIRANQNEYLSRAIRRYGQSSIINWREENCWDSQAIKPLLEEFQLELRESHLVLAIQELCPHEMIAKFIELGISVSGLVMQACLIHNASVLPILVKADCDPNYQEPSTGQTPLMVACQEKMPDTALRLLFLKADPCKFTAEGQTLALHHVPHVSDKIIVAYRIVFGMIRNGLTIDVVPEASRSRLPPRLVEFVRVLPSACVFVTGRLLDLESYPALLPMDILQFIMQFLIDSLPKPK